MGSKDLLHQAKAGGPGKKNGACFPSPLYDCTTSCLVKMTTEALKLQMRHGLVKESCLFLWHVLLA